MPRGVSPLDEARLQRRLWTPALVLPAVWLDAADLSTITIATGVSEWRDKSGFGRNFSQATAGNRPIYQAFGIKARPSVAFAGSSDHFMTASSVLPSGATAGSIFWVQTTEADPGTVANNFGCVISSNWGSAGSDNHFPFLDGNIYFTAFSTTRFLMGNPSKSLVNPRILGHESTNGNTALYIDGSSFFTSTTNTFTNPTSTKRLGQAINKFTGQLAELIVLSNIPAIMDRRRIEGYLAHKWGLTANLPADHPYLNRPPLIGD
jgi:hypothetical protein